MAAVVVGEMAALAAAVEEMVASVDVEGCVMAASVAVVGILVGVVEGEMAVPRVLVVGGIEVAVGPTIVSIVLMYKGGVEEGEGVVGDLTAEETAQIEVGAGVEVLTEFEHGTIAEVGVGAGAEVIAEVVAGAEAGLVAVVPGAEAQGTAGAVAGAQGTAGAGVEAGAQDMRESHEKASLIRYYQMLQLRLNLESPEAMVYWELGRLNRSRLLNRAIHHRNPKSQMLASLLSTSPLWLGSARRITILASNFVIICSMLYNMHL